MLDKLKKLFENHLESAAGENAGTTNKTIEFAAAVLMTEISRADSSIDEEERKVIDRALTTHFQLDADEAKEILELAEAEVDHSVSLHEFTRLITDNLDQEARIKILELLWRVAFADAVLDKYEEYFIRKISDLLYISHKDYIKTKHLASGEA